jgi:AMMECR1 domain-containing protein
LNKELTALTVTKANQLLLTGTLRPAVVTEIMQNHRQLLADTANKAQLEENRKVEGFRLSGRSRHRYISLLA